MTFRHYLFATLGAALMVLSFTSCSVDKYIGDEDYVLKRNNYQVDMPDSNATPKEIDEVLVSMKNYEVQSPNASILGLMRLKMRAYCLSNPADSGGFNRYLRRKGEAPVVYDHSAAVRTSKQLQDLLHSKGCFSSTVWFDTTRLRGHDISVNYHIQPSHRYKIDEVVYRTENEQVMKLMGNWRENSLLKEGDYYDQDKNSAERERLAANLRNEGYYYASRDNIVFLVDTTYSDDALSIEVWVRNPRVRTTDNQQVIVPFKQYRFDRFYFYPNSTTALDPSLPHDTLVYTYKYRNIATDYYFIDSKDQALSPRVIARSMFMFHNMLYRTRNVDRTYNSLLNLKNFKYINIEFKESPNSTADTGRLDAHIRLINNTRQKVSFSVELNNSSSYGGVQTGLNSGNFGLETVLSYQNKNLFGGAELLKMEGSFLIEIPKLVLSDKSSDHVSAFEAGINVSLDLPTLLTPFLGDIMWQRTKPHTVIGLGSNYQDREYFERWLANVSFGYSWSKNRNVQHQLTPIELTFARFFDIDSRFWNRIESIANNGRLKYQYSSHLIMDARYDYVYSNQVFGARQDFTYLHLSVETAGNLLDGLSHLFNGKTDSSDVRIIYGVPYSQYVRFNGELKHYFYWGQRNSFVARLMLGVGLPYGNSNNMQMPYEKSFFGGGPTTMRAWHLRHLGPGLYQHTDNNVLEHTGDMSVVINLEDRFPIIGIVEGALFADIGNVWLIHDNSEFPHGQFSFGNFFPSLAVGTGFGLRFNISILTLRIDVGLPVYDPGYAKGERIRLTRWREYPWKIQNSYFGPFIFNLGIDYPF